MNQGELCPCSTYLVYQEKHPEACWLDVQGELCPSTAAPARGALRARSSPSSGDLLGRNTTASNYGVGFEDVLRQTLSRKDIGSGTAPSASSSSCTTTTTATTTTTTASSSTYQTNHLSREAAVGGNAREGCSGKDLLVWSRRGAGRARRPPAQRAVSRLG